MTRQALATAITACTAAETALGEARSTLKRALGRLVEERERITSFETRGEAEDAACAAALAASFADPTVTPVHISPIGRHGRGDQQRAVQLLERAVVALEAGCRTAELASHTAIARRNAAAKTVIASEGRRLADDAAAHLALMLESYREVEPLTRLWLPSTPGHPGSAVDLDAPTVTALRVLAEIAADHPGPMLVPAAEQAEIRAANDRWRGYFARLCADPDAEFE